MTSADADGSVQVECGGTLHTVAYRDGALVALDHPSADRERALVALGGDRVPCVALLDAWTRHAADLDVLVLAPRGPGDSVATWSPLRFPHRGAGPYSSVLSMGPAPVRGRIRGRARGYAALSSMAGSFASGPDEPREPGIAELLALGGGLPRLLVAGVITTWWQRLAERPDDPDVVAALPQLRAATYGRARLALREWSGRVDVDVDVLEPGADAAVRRDSGRLAVSVPLNWLPDVWLPGLASMAGLFCLAAHSDRPGHWRIHGVDRNFETLKVGISVR